MRPLALKQTQKPRRDRGKPKARHSVSSSSSHRLGSSSHHEEDDKDEVTSRSTGADNRPPMLDKSQDRTYDNLTEPEKIREAFDIRETNTVLQGLPHNIYNLVNHHTEAKEIRELGQSQLINDMHMIEMSMQPLQVNIKFVNHLQPEWSKFVTDVKLDKDLHKTNFDHLYDYLRQHEAYENEVRLMRQRSPDPLSLGRQTQGYAGSGARSNATGTGVNRNGESNTVGQEIPTPAIFQTDDLVAFDFDYDEAPSASAVLMAKLYAYDSYILSEVPYLDTYQTNNAIDQSVQEMQYSKQPPFINDSDIDITNDNNVISYDQYLKETKNTVVQDTNYSTQQDAMIMSVIEEMSNQVAKCNEVNKVNKTVKES
ncbi:hypothetical protein Tco_0637481 [Tanacetum coccineum]